MERATEVVLAWASDRDGAHVHVSALDPGRRRERAPFTCLGCGEPLVPRLGRRRAHHFAHRPGSTCSLTRPETALHLNAKERLLFLCAEAFARRLIVRLGARCPACRRESPIDLAGAGDGAAPEHAAGELRTDVLVTRGGAPALALEVKVTHAIDPAKEATLAAMSLPALEIDAREPWEQAGADGVVAVRIARTFGIAPCGSCQAQARAQAGRREGGESAEVAELETYRARGLMGPRPGPALDATPPISEVERARIEARFACGECGGRALDFGDRVVRHPCGGAARAVAWRGYDGALVELAWWRRG